MTRIRGVPGVPPIGQVGVGVNAPPVQVPCPPGSGGGGTTPPGDCTPGIMGALLWQVAGCCVYAFWLTCVNDETVAAWSIDFDPTDGDNPPVFNFYPYMQDDSSAAGFLPGYAYLATVPGDSREQWAATAYFAISDTAGGFDHLVVSCDTYDPGSGVISGVDGNSLTTAELATYIACPSHVLGCTINITNGGNFFDPVGDTSTPNQVWLFFVAPPNPPGCITTSGTGDTTAGLIDDGSVGAPFITGGITKFCAAPNDEDGGCIIDISGCTPSIADADLGGTVDITGPIFLTADPDHDGWFYIDAETLGLWDSGADAPIAGVCTLNIRTDRGTAVCTIANSHHI